MEHEVEQEFEKVKIGTIFYFEGEYYMKVSNNSGVVWRPGVTLENYLALVDVPNDQAH